MANTKMDDHFLFLLAEILGKLGKFASSTGISEDLNYPGDVNKLRKDPTSCTLEFSAC